MALIEVGSARLIRRLMLTPQDVHTNTPVGTPLLADTAPLAKPPAAEPNEDAPEVAANDHDSAKVAAAAGGDADASHLSKAKKHAKIGKAKSHPKVAAKAPHGKHKLAKAGKASKSKLALHKTKAKPAKLAKAKLAKAKPHKGAAKKVAAKTLKAKKLASKSHAKHSAHSASSDN